MYGYNDKNGNIKDVDISIIHNNQKISLRKRLHEKLQKGVGKVKMRIVGQRKKIKKKVQLLVTHTFFYPLFLSFLTLGVAATLYTHADKDTTNILDIVCTKDIMSNQYKDCGSYESLRTVAYTALQGINIRVYKDTSIAQRRKHYQGAIANLLRAQSSIKSSALYTDQHDFAFHYIYHFFANQISLLSMDQKTLFVYEQSHGDVYGYQGGGYQHGSAPIQVTKNDAGLKENTSLVQQQFRIENISENNLFLATFAVSYQDGESALETQSLSSFSLRDSVGRIYYPQRREGNTIVFGVYAHVPVGTMVLTLQMKLQDTKNINQNIRFAYETIGSQRQIGIETLPSQHIGIIRNFSYQVAN